MEQMQEFDRFTYTIADRDPLKVAQLERGNLREYWQNAEGWATKLVHAKEMADKADPKKAGRPVIPTPKRRRRG